MSAIRRVADLTYIAANDDETVGVDLGFSVFIGGEVSTTATLSNNGYLVFDHPVAGSSGWGPYTPDLPLSDATSGKAGVFIFWADVDTRGIGSDVVRYGPASINGIQAWVANWAGVGYYWVHTDRLNRFQLIVYNRPGGYSFELNYDQIQWDVGDASSSTSALMGLYVPGEANYYRGWVGDSCQPSSLLDTNQSTGLIHNSYNTYVQGRYVFDHYAAPMTGRFRSKNTSFGRAG